MQIVHPLFIEREVKNVELSEEDQAFLNELDALESADELNDLLDEIRKNNKRIEDEEKFKKNKKRRWFSWLKN